MKLTNDIKYIGVNDNEIDLFEGQFIVENGMAYNSYVIIDDKIAIMDSVDAYFKEQWLKNIHNAIGSREPDYLVVHHMEPDHSANIKAFAETYPSAKIVGSAKSFAMMKQFFGTDFADRQIVVGEGDILDLGKHTLKFMTAPMVHWPEVIVSYDEHDKVLFSADAFGKFGTLDTDEDWACEARRYYFGIVGKYGIQVQALMKKISLLDISAIYPLHGPMLTKDLDYYMGLYQTWSSFGVESDGIVIAYTSVYGNTKKAVTLLARELEKQGQKVAINDLARCDMAEAVEDAFRYGKIVLATTTYNADIFPFMRTFIEALLERNYQNRTIGIIENGSWAPTAANTIKKLFEKSKNITFTENIVTIKSSITDDNKTKISALAAEICTEAK